MKGISLRDIDAVYAMMSKSMNYAAKIRYCLGIIDLTASFLYHGKGMRKGFKRRMSEDTITAARNEIDFLTQSSLVTC